MKELVSVVVPVYKVEEYLPSCIESVLAQTYDEFELLLIDDGTPDNSGKICDNYAKKDSRIKVIHKENGGVSTARNTGIENAKGKYITFIDSDDTVTKDYLEILINAAENGVYDFVHAEDDAEFAADPICADYNCEEKITENFAPLMWFLGPCAKLYKKEIVLRNKIFFKSEITFAEDTIFSYEYLSCCNKIRVITDVVYHYNKDNPTSALHKLHKNADVFLRKRNEAFCGFLEKLKIENDIKKILLDYFFCNSFLYLMSGCYQYGDKKYFKTTFLNNYDYYKYSLKSTKRAIKTGALKDFGLISDKAVRGVYLFTEMGIDYRVMRTFFLLSKMKNKIKSYICGIAKRLTKE